MRVRRPPAILRIIAYFFTVGVLLFVVLTAGATVFLWQYSRDLPDYEVLRKYEPPIMTRLYAGDGQLLAEYAKERRLYIPIQAIPKRLINAFLAAEDKNFYEHGGIDYLGVTRAFLNNAEKKIVGNRAAPQGASTITQQVAKNFLLSSEQTMDRKVKEALLSLKIEQAFTKDQILELYLNEIYLGLGSYGVAAASLVYFGKSIQELTLAECAYLAALPKAPNNYHPFRQRERAVERRNWVIGQMAENGFVRPDEAVEAKAEPLNVTPRSTGALIHAGDFFAEEVRRIIYERYGETGLYEGGLSVRTTLDPKLQTMLRKALVDGLVGYDQKFGWRGPVSRIDVSGDWGVKLGAVPALADVAPWRLAVVLSLSQSEAQIGLRPEKLPSGEIAEMRERGVITLQGLRWAKWASGDKRGKPVKSPADVLSVGDVVYVEPTPKGNAYNLRQPPEIQGGAVAMDPHTGRVLALVGGFSFFESEFNRATQAQRQPGSSFKPFIYAAALDNGYTPSSVVLDAPIEIKSGDETWRPENYSGEFYGPSTLRIGIERSRNLMTIRLAEDMGMALVAEYAKRFGIYGDNTKPVYSIDDMTKLIGFTDDSKGCVVAVEPTTVLDWTVKVDRTKCIGVVVDNPNDAKTSLAVRIDEKTKLPAPINDKKNIIGAIHKDRFANPVLGIDDKTKVIGFINEAKGCAVGLDMTGCIGAIVDNPKDYGTKLVTGLEDKANVIGIAVKDKKLPPYLSAALGSVETTVLRLTGAYAMLANGGKQIRPTLIDRIQDRQGRTVYRHDERKCDACNVDAWSGQDEPVLSDNRQQILDPMTAYQMVSMLEGVIQRGTGTKIAVVRKPLAGKTGTTNDYKDAWFVGFSPDLAMGVYLGHDKPRSMGKDATGGDLSAPVFRDFMKMALADKPAIPFRVPPGMHVVRINAKTGLRAGPGETTGILAEAFKPGTNPPDSYSVIGYTDQMGQPTTVTPEADRAVRLGTGGLY